MPKYDAWNLLDHKKLGGKHIMKIKLYKFLSTFILALSCLSASTFASNLEEIKDLSKTASKKPAKKKITTSNTDEKFKGKKKCRNNSNGKKKRKKNNCNKNKNQRRHGKSSNNNGNANPNKNIIVQKTTKKSHIAQDEISQINEIIKNKGGNLFINGKGTSLSEFLDNLDSNKILCNQSGSSPYDTSERVKIIASDLFNCINAIFNVTSEVVLGGPNVSSISKNDTFAKKNRVIKSVKKLNRTLKRMNRKQEYIQNITYNVQPSEYFFTNGMVNLDRLKSLKMMAFLGPVWQHFNCTPNHINFYISVYPKYEIEAVQIKCGVILNIVSLMLSNLIYLDFKKIIEDENYPENFLNGKYYSNLIKMEKLVKIISDKSLSVTETCKSIILEKLNNLKDDKEKLQVSNTTCMKGLIESNAVILLKSQEDNRLEEEQYFRLLKLAEKFDNTKVLFLLSQTKINQTLELLHKDTYEQFLKSIKRCSQFVKLYRLYEDKFTTLLKEMKRWKPIKPVKKEIIYLPNKSHLRIGNQQIVKKETTILKNKAARKLEKLEDKKNKQNVIRQEKRKELTEHYQKIEKYKKLISLLSEKEMDHITISNNVDLNDEELDEAIDVLELIQDAQKQKTSNTKTNNDSSVPEEVLKNQEVKFLNIKKCILSSKDFSALKEALEKEFESIKSLKFKKIKGTDFWSIRFNKQYRFVIWQGEPKLDFMFTKHYKGISQIKN